MDMSTAADRLEHARVTLTGLPLLSRDPVGLSAQEAWAIAAEVDRWLLERGRHRTGYKLGWTSDAMRDAGARARPARAARDRGELTAGRLARFLCAAADRRPQERAAT